ncbi:uncharacterized protein LOC111251386 isoform X2 [Varroa destructor]|uniref:Uncharacterized protein n=1 Tax=Varroa destructor TaxID=109461 RepID=A0A7M7KNS5_VARDE|nr:uncharacterized protein LOC111251386 isoform X2 [Varroa destructor]
MTVPANKLFAPLKAFLKGVPDVHRKYYHQLGLEFIRYYHQTRCLSQGQHDSLTFVSDEWKGLTHVSSMRSHTSVMSSTPITDVKNFVGKSYFQCIKQTEPGHESRLLADSHKKVP